MLGRTDAMPAATAPSPSSSLEDIYSDVSSKQKGYIFRWPTEALPSPASRSARSLGPSPRLLFPRANGTAARDGPALSPFESAPASPAEHGNLNGRGRRSSGAAFAMAESDSDIQGSLCQTPQAQRSGWCSSGGRWRLLATVTRRPRWMMNLGSTSSDRPCTRRPSSNG